MQFRLPVRPLQAPGVNDQQGQQPHNEAEKQYFYWLEVHQQNFGGDKGRSPNDDGKQGGEMARFFSINPFYSNTPQSP